MATVKYFKSKHVVTDQHFGKVSLTKLARGNLADDDDGRILMDFIRNKKAALISKPGISIKSDKSIDDNQGITDFGSQLENENTSAIIHIHMEKPADTDNYITCKCVGDSGVFNIVADENDNNPSIFVINYSSAYVGSHKCVLIFSCKDTEGKWENVCHFLQGQTNSVDMEILMPTEPYRRPKPVITVQDSGYKVIRGVPPNGSSGPVSEVPLKEYRIPSKIRSNVNRGKGNVTGHLKELLEAELSSANHEKKFHLLLYLEELQLEVDIRRYDLSNQKINSATSGLMSLKVRGLAEGRPSLIIWDRLFASRVGDEDKKTKFEGYIHDIQEENILVKFATRFVGEHSEDNLYNIEFSFNRFTLRMMHRALEVAHKLISDHIYPASESDQSYSALLSKSQMNRLRIFDDKIESNPEQLKAVKNIAQGLSRPYPYIIFGPPGTGKTVTMVEAIRQVLSLIPGSRVLACAPSNSAADLILHRLLNPCPIDKEELFRMNAKSRALLTLPPELDVKDCCLIENGRFALPAVTKMMSYRVVVSTMTTAGRLLSMGVPMGHFTHVFMDECGQAVEPETFIPLAGLFNPDCQIGGQIVLAGDPKQLGPVLRSPFACQYGLQTSLLERLMGNCSKYQRSSAITESDDDSSEDESFEDFMDKMNDSSDSDDVEKGVHDEKYITKLIKNYRSHPDILKLPNDLFYDGELVPAADESARNSLCRWKELPNNKCPMIFHGVQGEDLREANSPSFFNPQEVKIVNDYVDMLLGDRRLNVTPDQIGIISPYRKQVEKIRTILSSSKHYSKMNKLIKVGSVEEFQGQERRIIIITTVRSNKEYLQLDSKYRLGFLSNPKRFNVAITRAQSLLIMIGNPHVLAMDNCWNSLLQFCREKKCYVGCEFVSKESMKDIIDSIKQLAIKSKEPSTNEESS